LGISQSCAAIRSLGDPVRVLAGSGDLAAGSDPLTAGTGEQETVNRSQTLLAVAGIANPERFVASLRTAGWNVADRMTFQDHHRYSLSDLTAIAAKMQACGADAVFTTDKDAVRFESLGTLPFAMYRVPLRVEFEPAAALFESVGAVLK
jgi:tetraacyldisaccharide-1-P 4'-kinase